MSFLDGLNPSQRAAVENIYGPTMVIAGAGSGKTRVLTFRIAQMLAEGIDPFNILALTFTNKAAKEMQERIAKISVSGAMGHYGASEAKHLTMGTFHSVFSRILRFNAERIGYPQNFTIYDTQDSKSLIKDVIKELKLDDKTYKPSSVLGRISTAKNNLVSADEYLNSEEIMTEDRMARRPEMGRIYKTYAARCFKAGAMDFDDLLFQTFILLRDFPDVLGYYQQKFKYILVDEYQDTNYAQYMIVKMLAAAYENLCVVGDDAQSIYSFRGANIQNILNFQKDYPDFQEFKLEQNYRSTKNIVEAANSVIARNQDRIKKEVWTDNQEGKPIHVIRTLTDNEEGKFVANRLYDVKSQEGLSYNDFAILYRTNRQSRSFEEAFRKLNIPYKIYGGLSFYQRKEIKDLLAYFRLTTNPRDEEAFKRVINYPKRGIGKTTIENLVIASNNYGMPIWDVVTNMTQYPVPINGAARTKLEEFATMIRSFSAQLHKLNAYELGQHIAKSSGVLKDLYAEKEKGPEEVERYQNIEELLGGLKEFTISKEDGEANGLDEFMIDVALLTDADEDKGDDRNHVTMMTIHSSKGLEFKHVFLVGLEENLFPSQMALQSRSETEEERRLFYVAVTRAMETCTITYAASRFLFGSLTNSEPSRFIDEIDSKYLNFENLQRGGGRSLNSGRPIMTTPGAGGLNRSLNTEPAAASSRSMQNLKPVSRASGGNDGGTEYKVGYVVIHERFGKGKILKIEGQGPDKQASIFFPGHGAKQLLLRFAKLQIVEQ